MKKILLSLALAGGVQNSFAMGSCGGGVAQSDMPVCRKRIRPGTINLFEAASEGNFRAVKRILDAGHAGEQSEDGCTPLMHAAQNGQVAVVQEFINYGLPVDAQNSGGWTSLMYAAHNGHAAVVRALVKAGADLDKQINDNSTALIFAAEKGHAEVVKELIEGGADVNVQNNCMSTALMFAANHGNPKVVSELIEAGAVVDEQNNFMQTPLMFAAKSGHKGVVCQLIESGANVRHKDYANKEAKDYTKDSEIKDLLTTMPISIRPKVPTNAIGRFDPASFGASQPVNINQSDEGNYLSNLDKQLFDAVRQGNVNNIRSLVKLKADVNARKYNGETALMQASQNGQLRVLRALIRRGADIDAQTSFGETALMQVQQMGRVAIAGELIARGADVDLTDYDGKNALDYKLQGIVKHQKI